MLNMNKSFMFQKLYIPIKIEYCNVLIRLYIKCFIIIFIYILTV